jgi:hypothetical protein
MTSKLDPAPRKAFDPATIVGDGADRPWSDNTHRVGSWHQWAVPVVVDAHNDLVATELRNQTLTVTDGGRKPEVGRHYDRKPHGIGS